jgi:hypothetical protein
MKGGRGDGVGPYTGDGIGGDPADPTILREQRWRMIFSTNNGNDYLRQLNALGAILRVDKDGKAYFIRNLIARPAKPVAEDPATIRQVHWIDDDSASVESVAQALQLGWTPEKVYVYFPKSLETNLVNKELAYGKRYGRMKEEDISETHFKIEFSHGAPVISIVYQAGKK